VTAIEFWVSKPTYLGYIVHLLISADDISLDTAASESYSSFEE
jgi:hypothetical protein